MPKPSFSHDSQDHPCLSPWIPDDATCPSLHTSPTINVKSLHDLQPSDSSPYYRFAPDSPQTGSLLQLPIASPSYYPDSFMEMSPPELTAYNSLPHILTGQDHTFPHHQPPSPPDDTPELVQRELPRIGFCEPPSPPLESPSDVDDLPPILDSTHSPSGYLRNLEHEPGGTMQLDTRRCCQSHYDNAGTASERAGLFPGGPQLSPEQDILTPDSPSWTTTAFLDSDFSEDEPMPWSVDRSRGQATKARGNSLDSSQQDAYEFMAPVHRPLRSFTTPTPSSQQPRGQLGELWDSSCVDIGCDTSHSPRANLASFDFSFDDHSPDFPSSLLSQSPREETFALFDESYGDNAFENPVGLFPAGFEPSSPHSPHMQLLPDSEGPMDCQPTTISPSLLGLPDSEIGLGLDVDGIDRSPSPSDYELQLLDGSTDVPLHGLSEEEFQGLRAMYEQLSRSEAAARERENVLDRRVKDISALLKPPRASPDSMVMLARRQELRAATDMRIEARKVRKEEKRRLRELGALLDVKLNCAVFRSKGIIQSVPQLVADMVFKRHDRCRPLANRKAASYCRTHVPSPLRSSFTEDSIVSADDVSLMDSMSADGSDEDERMTVM